MKRTKLASWFFVCTVMLLFSACIQCESEEVEVTLNENLSGKVTFKFTSISSTEENAAAQEAEMNDFCRDLAKTADSLKELGLKNATFDVTNQTPFKCDAALKGEFENILTILPLLGETEKNDFEVARIDNLFSMRWQVKGMIADSPDIFSLEYRGEILDHNAQSYDPEAQALRWTVKDSDNRSISFRIRPRSDN